MSVVLPCLQLLLLQYFNVDYDQVVVFEWFLVVFEWFLVAFENELTAN